MSSQYNWFACFHVVFCFLQGNASQREMMSGQHNWYACSHARPTYCNVCREALSGVTSHGLSCEGMYQIKFYHIVPYQKHNLYILPAFTELYPKKTLFWEDLEDWLLECLYLIRIDRVLFSHSTRLSVPLKRKKICGRIMVWCCRRRRL